MKHYLLSLILGTGVLLSGAEGRTWTSADGSKTFEGELQSYDAASGKVSVTLSNGKRMTFLQDKLSAEDIAWLKRNGGRPAGSHPTLAVADLDGVAGKVFDLNPDGSFRFLKQDVQIDPETGKGQAWFSAYAGKDVEIVQWEDRKNLAGLKNPVIAVFTGFDDANAKALKDGKSFRADHMVLRPDLKEAAGVSDDGQTLTAWFTPRQAGFSRDGVIKLGDKEIPGGVKGGGVRIVPCLYRYCCLARHNRQRAEQVHRWRGI